MRSFLGMFNVYRRFVPNFPEVEAPITRYTSKNGSTNLPSTSNKELRAFELLKEALTSPPILRQSDPELLYSVETNASMNQIGEALFQEFEDAGVRQLDCILELFSQ